MRLSTQVGTTPAVRFGVDTLLSAASTLPHSARVGLVTNESAITADLRPALFALRDTGIHVAALFAPEHGLGAALPAGQPVGHGVEPHTGLPVYSLYGETCAPTREMLAPLTHLLLDLPDVGARFYTYTSTMVATLRVAARHALPVLILDRPNPLGGVLVEGPRPQPGYHSFVGALDIAIRHGMTIGELALLGRERLEIPAEVEIVRLEGWRREHWFDETGLPWAPPSPNIPRPETALVYAGTCLVEGTTLSEGRGTALPFEIVGAPWLDGSRLADELNRLALPGVRFRPTTFTPCAGKHAHQLCRGVQLHVRDRDTFRPVRSALFLLVAARAQAPGEFAFRSPAGGARHPTFDLLIGNGTTRPALEQGLPVEEIIAGWEADEVEFAAMRRPYLLYREMHACT